MLHYVLVHNDKNSVFFQQHLTNDLLPSVTHAYFPLFKGFARQGVIWLCKQLHQHNLSNILYGEHRFGDHSSDHQTYVHHPL
jgi:hypothetical protein